jgi:hypothetical protein
MRATLDGVEGKIRRAGEHLDAWIAEVAEVSARNPYAAIKERSADGTEVSLTLRVDEMLPFARWSLIIGDCVHNLRSALDHLIYAAAITHAQSDPPPGQRRLMFFIGRDDLHVENNSWRLGDLWQDQSFRTTFKELQPYNRPEAEGLRPLAVLEEFDVRDKHRLLNVVLAVLDRPHYTIDGHRPGDRGTLSITVGEVEAGTKLISISNATPNPQIDVKFDEHFIAMAIRHDPASTDGRIQSGVDWLLRSVIAEVEHVVSSLRRFVT